MLQFSQEVNLCPFLSFRVSGKQMQEVTGLFLHHTTSLLKFLTAVHSLLIQNQHQT